MKFNKKYIGKIFRDFLIKKSNQISKNKTEIKNMIKRGDVKTYERVADSLRQTCRTTLSIRGGGTAFPI